jgi:hypothetical protein
MAIARAEFGSEKELEDWVRENLASFVPEHLYMVEQ